MGDTKEEKPKKRWWTLSRSIWWKIIPGTALSLILLAEASLIITGKRLLYDQVVARPGTSYVVGSYGEVGKQIRTQLICHYFTGLSTQTQLVWYDPANKDGLDECPVITAQKPLGQTQASGDGGSSVADWAGVRRQII